MTIEIHPQRPEPELEAWEQVAEFSMLVKGSSLGLASTHGGFSAQIPPLPPSADVTYRLHSLGRAQGADADYVELGDTEEPIEHHMIQIWPAPLTPEAWLKGQEDIP